MMSRILDIGTPEDLPREHGTLINYFDSKIVNDTNGRVMSAFSWIWLVDPGRATKDTNGGH